MTELVDFDSLAEGSARNGRKAKRCPRVALERVLPDWRGQGPKGRLGGYLVVTRT